MKTKVLMKRKLFDQEILQDSKNEFFSATDLVRAGNKWRQAHDFSMFNLSQFLQAESTKEFINEIENKYKIIPFIKGKGRTAHTWVHPLLFIDIALAINPKLKIEVYDWLYDNLIKYRNTSGDSYKKMSGALYQRIGDKYKFPKYIAEVATQIQETCQVKNWQEATEEQLNKRDKIHENIALLCEVLNNPNEAVRLALVKS